MICRHLLRVTVTATLGVMLLVLPTEAATKVTSQPFGKTSDGTPVEIFTLSDGEYEARIATYGGVLVSLKAPDRNGRVGDIVLGFEQVDGYVANFNGPSDAFFGALIGRFANRRGHARFTLDGHQYSLPRNNGGNALHGARVQ